MRKAHIKIAFDINVFSCKFCPLSFQVGFWARESYRLPVRPENMNLFVYYICTYIGKTINDLSSIPDWCPFIKEV